MPGLTAKDRPCPESPPRSDGMHPLLNFQDLRRCEGREQVFRFDGATVVVVGGGSGIGAACVRAFHDCGAFVHVADLDVSAASDVVGLLGAGNRLRPVKLDIAETENVSAALSEAAARTGTLDVLVNCAGVLDASPVVEIEPSRWRRVHAVNLDGTFFACQCFARLATRSGRGGAIVNVASVAGITALPNRPAYVSSKHGVVGLTKELALELAPLGVRVNAVAPGIVRTPMTEFHFQDPAKVDRMAKSNALGRAGSPEEIAAAVRFLASSHAAYITGAVLPIDGGMVAGKYW
jgi:meso-butanediol dehydrogenase / (S,S)-butanediol dehydrogenase / diacetyl reductase